MTYGSGAILPQPVLDLMATKSIEEFQTNQQTMNEDFGPTPENLCNDSLSQPIQGFHMSVKEYYNQFCIWISKLETVNSVHYVDDDEWYVVDFIYGLKMDLMTRVLQHRRIRRVSEAFRWAEIEEHYGENDADVVFDGMSNPESKHCDELQEAEDVGNENSDEIMVQIEEDSGKEVSLTIYGKVLDEFPLPAFMETTAYKAIKSGEGIDSLQNSLVEALKFDKSTKPALTCDGIVIAAPVGLRFNEMEDLFAPKGREVVPNSNKILIYPSYDKGGNGMVLMENTVMFYIDPGGIMESLIPNKVENQLGVMEEQTSWMKMGCSKIGTSVYLQEDVYGGAMSRHKYELLLLSRVRVKNVDEFTSAEAQLCVTDPCSRGSSLHHGYATKNSLEARKEKHGYGAISSALHECALPGISLKLLKLRRQTSGHLLIDTMPELIVVEHTQNKECLNSCEYSVVYLPNALGYKAIVIASLELDVYLCVDAMLMIIFDPGGSPLCHKRGSFFMQNCDLKNLLGEFNSAIFDLSWTSLYSYHMNDLVYLASCECKTVTCFTNLEAMFLANPGGSYYLLRVWIWNGVICEEQRPDPKSGNLSHNRAGTYSIPSRFEEVVDGRKDVMECDPCSEFDEFTEATPTALFNEKENGHYAHNLFDECPQPFFIKQSVRIAGNVDKVGVVLPIMDLQSVLSPRDETTINGSCNGSTKARIREQTSNVESVWGETVTKDHVHDVFDRMTNLIATTRLTVSLVINDRNDHSFLKMVGSQMFGGVEQSFWLWIKSTKTYSLKLDEQQGQISGKHNNGTQVLVFDPGIRATGKFEQKLNSRLLQYSGHYMDSHHFELNGDKNHFHSGNWINGEMGFSTCNAAIGNGDFLGRSHSKHLRYASVRYEKQNIELIYYVLVVLDDGVCCMKTWLCLMFPLCVLLVWDPGPCGLFAYILEDKDVVVRVGKDMVLMDATLAIRKYDHEVQMSCLNTMEDFGRSILHIGLVTSRLGRFELGLIASDLKHFKQYSDSHDYDDVFIAKLQNLVWDPDQNNIFLYIFKDMLRPKRFKLHFLWDILYASRGLPTGFGNSAAASLVSSTLELEHFIWDPGSFIAVLQAF